VAFLPSPSSNGIYIEPFFLHAYGLMYAVAVLVAVAIVRRRWTAQGGRRELVDEVALWGFAAGLIGARLYFLATSWDEVPHHWWGPWPSGTAA
jgi:prolipoprotein diacylglyceryltransferase